MSMTARLSLAGLLLLAVPLSGAQAPDAAAEAAGRAAERAEAMTAAEAATAADSAARAADAEADAREAEEVAVGGEVEETFSPTERVPADASIRFPVDI